MLQDRYHGTMSEYGTRRLVCKSANILDTRTVFGASHSRRMVLHIASACDNGEGLVWTTGATRRFHKEAQAPGHVVWLAFLLPVGWQLHR